MEREKGGGEQEGGRNRLLGREGGGWGVIICWGRREGRRREAYLFVACRSR